MTTPQQAWKERNADKVLEDNRKYNNSEAGQDAQARFDKKHGKSKRAEYQKGYRDRINAVIIAYKTDRPCIDCGIELPPQVMEFDHVRGVKLFTISHWHRFPIKGTGLTRLEVIEQEMAKCDIRCPNCHDMRHFTERSGHYASSLVN